MKIAVASGKGGTGKTTLAVGLAVCLGERARLLDCDVEEPNCHIFLKPELDYRETLGIPVPVVDTAKCDACGKCAALCQFNAIAVVKSGAMVFGDLCHGCGGCTLVCPTGAISEGSRTIGTLETGKAGAVEFVVGRLRVGEAMSPPLIRAVKKHALPNRINIIDAPPGTSCPAIAAVKDSDYVILVTEPTPFGLNDLQLAVETVRLMRMPFGVVINRADAGDSGAEDYCRGEGIRLLMQIPHSRRVAEAYSRGRSIVEALPELRPDLIRLVERLREETA
jgi:MinD superfamily P-loop ATPase